MRDTQKNVETETEKTIVIPAYRARLTVEDFTQAVNAAQRDTIVIVSIANRVELPFLEDQTITLGRFHPPNKTQPTLDLNKYGAASGTSRTHASIWRDKGEWFIEDLASSNGTWVNGERLAPFVAHRLMSLNRVILANMEIGVSLPDKPSRPLFS